MYRWLDLAWWHWEIAAVGSSRLHLHRITFRFSGGAAAPESSSKKWTPGNTRCPPPSSRSHQSSTPDPSDPPSVREPDCRHWRRIDSVPAAVNRAWPSRAARRGRASAARSCADRPILALTARRGMHARAVCANETTWRDGCKATRRHPALERLATGSDARRWS